MNIFVGSNKRYLWIKRNIPLFIFSLINSSNRLLVERSHMFRYETQCLDNDVMMVFVCVCVCVRECVGACACVCVCVCAWDYLKM